MDNGVVEIVDLSDLSKRRLSVGQDLQHRTGCLDGEGFLRELDRGLYDRLGLLDEEGHLEGLTDEDQMVMASSVTPDGNDWPSSWPAFLNLEIYLDGRKITDIASIHPRRERVRKERLSWKSCDGTEIHGVLNLPTDFDSSRKYLSLCWFTEDRPGRLLPRG